MRKIVLICIVLLIIGLSVWHFTKPSPIAVVLVEAQKGNVEASISNTRAGSIEACQRTRLSPITGGRIAYLGVKKGDRVKKGQVLIRLWNDDQKAQNKLALAQVKSAQKKLGEACNLADSAEREAARAAQLRKQGFISEGAEEKARYTAQSRRSSCDAMRANIEQALAKVNVTQAELGRTVLVAPFDGIVADIVGELGEYTTPSPPGVATPPAIDLIDDACLYVEAPMDEVDAPKIRIGQPVRISLDSLPNEIFHGTVKRVAPYIVAVEKQARTVDIEVSFDDTVQDKQLLVGYSADVEVILDTRNNVLRVPTTALLDGNRVLIYQADTQRLVEKQIQVGISNWAYSEVLSGLEEGDRIVSSLEREGIKAGALVTPDVVDE